MVIPISWEFESVVGFNLGPNLNSENLDGLSGSRFFLHFLCSGASVTRSSSGRRRHRNV